MKKKKEFLGIAILTMVFLFAMMAAGARAAADQSPSFFCSIKVPEPEPDDLSTLAKITADKAMAAAQAAYPGARAQIVELENENGCLIYSVNLSNGLEVKVDAGNGTVFRPEREESESE